MSKIIEFYKLTSIMGAVYGGICGFVCGIYKTNSNERPLYFKYYNSGYIFTTTSIGAVSGLLYPITFPYYVHRFNIIDDFKNLFKR